MRTFTAKEVMDISGKILSQLVESGLPEVQRQFILLGFLNLYAELINILIRDYNENS